MILKTLLHIREKFRKKGIFNKYKAEGNLTEEKSSNSDFETFYSAKSSIEEVDGGHEEGEGDRNVQLNDETTENETLVTDCPNNWPQESRNYKNLRDEDKHHCSSGKNMIPILWFLEPSEECHPDSLRISLYFNLVAVVYKDEDELSDAISHTTKLKRYVENYWEGFFPLLLIQICSEQANLGAEFSYQRIENLYSFCHKVVLVDNTNTDFLLDTVQKFKQHQVTCFSRSDSCLLPSVFNSQWICSFCGLASSDKIEEKVEVKRKRIFRTFSIKTRGRNNKD